MQQLQFHKLYCQVHPYELVTNYCNDEKCLVGLCATCICSHTQLHARLGTIPQYQNIRDTYTSLHQEARSQISTLQDDKNELGRLRESIQVKKITLRKTIKHLREETLKKVKEEFDYLERKITADITSEERKHGYYSNARLESLSKSLTRETETLLNYISQLNSNNFLQCTRKLKIEALLNSQKERKRIQDQIEENQRYSANLKWNQNYLNQILSVIRQMFTLQFVLPQNKRENQNEKSHLQVRPSNTMPKAFSVPKFNSQILSKNSSILNLDRFASTAVSSFFDNYKESNEKPLQKQSRLRKEQIQLSDLSESDVVSEKENQKHNIFSSRDSEVLNRSNLIYKLGYIPKGKEEARNFSTISSPKNDSVFKGRNNYSTISKGLGSCSDSKMKIL